MNEQRFSAGFFPALFPKSPIVVCVLASRLFLPFCWNDQAFSKRLHCSLPFFDCAAYLDEEEEEDTEQRRPSRSKRSLTHPHPKSGQSSNPAASMSRRRIPQPSTSTDRADRGATSRRRRTSFDVSGIAALPNSDDEDEQPPARHSKKRRFVPSPVEEDYCSQENVTSMKTAKKNKRPLNGPSAAKNRRQVSCCVTSPLKTNAC